MPATQLKDYYKILEIPATATDVEIKKAFRKMALKHHPDTSAGNAYAESNFREVKEAYGVLGNEFSRRKYDEEYWLAGMARRARQYEDVTPGWILQEVIRLDRHMAGVDTYRMSHKALHDYVFLLLDDRHLSVLRENKEDSLNEAIINMILQSTKGLKLEYMNRVAEKLRELSDGNDRGIQHINAALRDRQKQAVWERRLPYFIALLTLIIVIAMYFWAVR